MSQWKRKKSHSSNGRRSRAITADLGPRYVLPEHQRKVERANRLLNVAGEALRNGNNKAAYDIAGLAQTMLREAAELLGDHYEHPC